MREIDKEEERERQRQIETERAPYGVVGNSVSVDLQGGRWVDEFCPGCKDT